MRTLLLVILILLSVLNLRAQVLTEPEEGTVTYVTSQNIYVRFFSTARIATGDTLYVRHGENLVPALKVWERSSISCVCTAIPGVQLNTSDKVYIRVKQIPPPAAAPAAAETVAQPVTPMAVPAADTVKEKAVVKKSRQEIRGYFAIASYTNLSEVSAGNSQRMQYTFSLNALNLGNSNLSAECYVSFSHRDKQWEEIQQNVFNGLRIYNLNVSYRFNRHFFLLLGRKINPNLSSMGPVDGLQYEMKFGNVTIGLLGGTRPDYRDYSFNASLIQAGAFVSHEKKTKNGYYQTSLAFIEQRNSGQVDRRFVYLQHSNSVVKNLSFFGSAEIDLYRLVFDTIDSTYNQKNSAKLSNLYLSLRYRATRKLSFSLSYNARQNVIYYESYKSLIDKLSDTKTLQGYLFQFNYRPVNRLTLGATAAYRFRNEDPRDTKNLYAYLTYTQVPGLGISATLSGTFLETGYINGNIYGLSLDRDLFKGKVYAGIAYRYVNYRFTSEEQVIQNVGEFNLTWRIFRRISFSLYYEGTFEKITNVNRIYGQLNLGF